ncbi:MULTISPECIES: hypothetical protein [unclassified Tatumella]|uniref:hypothetical protein n=1 Tax=unclassified Tatumella TaxID=2649542 RepID=UPI001BAF0F30|nr:MULTISPECIES: hypothetical protein [unclassified Tatumella]MBS0855044.1 hypothetical protein [Tatumella sp. JGM16]MBS0876075.1 hypothetical protein [Tatumella sp. JGM82]MBS0890549.1 hypothetical protein [Tatumella sp. JGM94]MBS0892660.1 hypothetical protein [Tatumella sp. JGM130]MBS0901005.1 hypothetical protein [Tatumella sp. JGM100]
MTMDKWPERTNGQFPAMPASFYDCQWHDPALEFNGTVAKITRRAEISWQAYSMC